MSGLVIHVLHTSAEGPAPAAQVAPNAWADLGDVPIEVVLQGGVVTAALKGSVSTVLLDLVTTSPMRVAVCANSLRAKGLGADDVHAEFDVVGAAVGHLARRQWEGGAYVRI